MCLGQNNDWCTYACIAARDRDDFMYTMTGMTDLFCMNEQSYDSGPTIEELYTWSNCRNDQVADACQVFCDRPSDYSFLTFAQAEVACVWANAPSMTEAEMLYDNCRWPGDPDWCTYICIAARDNGNTWYWDSDREFACARERWYN